MSNKVTYVENMFSKFDPILKLESELDLGSDLGSDIKFETVNRNGFKLCPEDAGHNLIPLVLIGDKRSVCNYVNYINECSPEYRSKLKLKRGKLIPFKMVDVNDLNINENIIKNINLLCIISEVFNESIEHKIRFKLKSILTIYSDQNDTANNNTKFIKTVTTIYLRSDKSNMKITRINHQTNQIEISMNIFKIKMKSYSDYPEFKWSELIDLKYNPLFVDKHSSECTICSKNIEPNNLVYYSRCRHKSCLECAGSIVSITKTCPFCRIVLSVSDLVLSIKYVPSFFSALKEFINSQEKDNLKQSIIYLESDIAIQHLLNYLIQNIDCVIDVLSTDIQNDTQYYLASSNKYVHLLDNLTKIIVCPDNESTKNLMLDYKSYSTNYGTGNQELIILESK